MMYRSLIKPILMKMDAESAHEWAVKAITNPITGRVLGLNRIFAGKHRKLLKIDLCGIPLENPIGLAAGFDKNALMFPHLHQMGFGFVEVGTVTAHAQEGNPRPRLFRLQPDLALINRMGFNNDGVEVVAKRVAARVSPIPIGGNIGKSKITPLQDAVSDYERSFFLLKPHVQYFVVNVSSPNTPDLRKLQDREPLSQLLHHLMALNCEPRLPLFLKIAPDLTEGQLEDIVSVVEECAIAGVIATNTTIERKGLKTPATAVSQIGNGGLSGAPLKARSTEVIRFLAKNLPAKTAIIGVGGIFNGEDAYQKIRAGARCLQVYTGLIYGGPATVYKIQNQLAQLLIRDGFANLEAAIGADL